MAGVAVAIIGGVISLATGGTQLGLGIAQNKKMERAVKDELKEYRLARQQELDLWNKEYALKRKSLGLQEENLKQNWNRYLNERAQYYQNLRRNKVMNLQQSLYNSIVQNNNIRDALIKLSQY